MGGNNLNKQQIMKLYELIKLFNYNFLLFMGTQTVRVCERDLCDFLKANIDQNKLKFPKFLYFFVLLTINGKYWRFIGFQLSVQINTLFF